MAKKAAAAERSIDVTENVILLAAFARLPSESNGLPPPLPSFMFVCELPPAEEVFDAAPPLVGLLEVSTSRPLVVEAALDAVDVPEVAATA